MWLLEVIDRLMLCGSIGGGDAGAVDLSFDGGGCNRVQSGWYGNRGAVVAQRDKAMMS